MSDVRIETLILALNEADHIEAAVASAIPLGPVYVVDSGSTDGTQEMARALGAEVVHHDWEGYAKQKNWALDNLPWRGKWIFILDADERIGPELRKEIERTVERGTDVDGFYVNRVVLFMGAPIRHGGLYPSWNLRFFRGGTCRYENRAVHEHMICTGTTAHLTEEMVHIRDESMTEYIGKHIVYADLESGEWVKHREGVGGGAQSSALFKRSLRFRQWIKRRVWPHVPMRPLIRFLHMYVLRLGILDGRMGLQVALLMASYEYMISLLHREKLRALKKGSLDAAALELAHRDEAAVRGG